MKNSLVSLRTLCFKNCFHLFALLIVPPHPPRCELFYVELVPFFHGVSFFSQIIWNSWYLGFSISCLCFFVSCYVAFWRGGGISEGWRVCKNSLILRGSQFLQEVISFWGILTTPVSNRWVPYLILDTSRDGDLGPAWLLPLWPSDKNLRPLGVISLRRVLQWLPADLMLRPTSVLVGAMPFFLSTPPLPTASGHVWLHQVLVRQLHLMVCHLVPLLTLLPPLMPLSLIVPTCLVSWLVSFRTQVS